MAKKKKSVSTASEEPVVDQQLEPPEEPSIQIEEVQVAEQTEPEPVAQAESTPIVEPAEKVEPQPIVEPAPAPVPPAKPKPLTLISLSGELNALRQVVDEQGKLIAQLLEAPTRQRKPPTSNGKIMIKDKQTGKIYPSKNNVYQSLLKAGELKELVDAGVFGPNPAKNSFGCYNLFRAWPNRFEEVHEELSV